MMNRRPTSQRGVALLVVLLLLATMSAIAISMTSTMRTATARAGSVEALDQIRWYALGAEQLAGTMLEQQWQATGGRNTRQDPYFLSPIVFPIDNGMIEVSVTDATLCFNVNSLVMNEEGQYRPDPEARERWAY